VVAITLQPQQLTRENFAPFGDVIETSDDRTSEMNADRFERFDDLCSIDMGGDGRPTVSIARCRIATSLPYDLDMVERHPLGSQAFIPLSPSRMVVVVAPAGETVSAADLHAFVTNGRQGINYHRGTWHMPLIAFEEGQQFLIIDRAPDQPNCEHRSLDEAVKLVEG
jgi:ureidoglycolate lyase